jgi:hypothetical protein
MISRAHKLDSGDLRLLATLIPSAALALTQEAERMEIKEGHHRRQTKWVIGGLILFYLIVFGPILFAIWNRGY